jgi:hypothetical protein
MFNIVAAVWTHGLLTITYERKDGKRTHVKLGLQKYTIPFLHLIPFSMGWCAYHNVRIGCELVNIGSKS